MSKPKQPLTAPRALAEANRTAREAGHRFTSDMEVAGEALSNAQKRLKQAEADFDLASGGPEPVELSDVVVGKMRQSFPLEQQPEAIRLLEKECARNLPFHEDADAQGLERVRLAVVKLASGSLTELRRQIAVAKQDWRDVIALAEYPEAVRLGLAESTKLEDEARRALEARDRAQYVAWLNATDNPPPSAT